MKPTPTPTPTDKPKPKPKRKTKTKTKPASRNNPRNLITSLILVFPLFLLYQVGVVLIYPLINGADFLTRFLFQNVGLSRSAYLGYAAAIAALFAITVAVLRRRQSINLFIFVPVLLESAIYALTMGSVIVLVMTRVFRIDPRLAVGLSLTEQGLLARMVMSVGAGVWEEAVFRLGILSATSVIFERLLGVRRALAFLFALLLSSLLFSAAHHIPPTGEPLLLGVFVFRVLAGVCFGLLFRFRGFAVAAYTHALYDLYVLILRP